MSRQSEIDKIVSFMDCKIPKYRCRIMAENMVDKGIGTKNRFRIYYNEITPIEYKDDVLDKGALYG